MFNMLKINGLMGMVGPLFSMTVFFTNDDFRLR